MTRRHKSVTNETQINEEPIGSSKRTVDRKQVLVNAVSATLSCGRITNNGPAKGRPDASVRKVLFLDANGKLKKDSVASIYKGRARVETFEFSEFGDILGGLIPSQTITLGVPHYGEDDGGSVIDDGVLLLTKDQLGKSRETAISRTKEYFKMLKGMHGLALIDLDSLPDNIETLDDILPIRFTPKPTRGIMSGIWTCEGN